jgi:hypothetical protein
MASSSTVPVFLSALDTQLSVRFAGVPALATVKVEIVPTGDTTAVDVVTLLNGEVTGLQGRKAMGLRSDGWRIPGLTTTYHTDPNASTAFQGAWDRCGLIMDEIEKELRDNRPQVGTSTFDGMVIDNNYRAFLADKGGWYCECNFFIEYEAIVS